MATVNGRKITRTEVQKFYDSQVAELAAASRARSRPTPCA